MPTDYPAVTRIPVAGETRPDWMAHGLCRSADDADLHHPDGYGRRYRQQIIDAKAMCRRCPATAACLRFALDRGESWGIYGGTTPDERAALRGDTVSRLPQRATPIRPSGAGGLTPAAVAEIRARWAAEPRISQDALAARYRVSRATIGAVVRGESWKQVPA